MSLKMTRSRLAGLDDRSGSTDEPERELQRPIARGGEPAQCASKHLARANVNGEPAMGLKSNVLATLSSPQVKWINFAFANRMLSPVMYRSLYGLVDGGTIKCEVDSNLNDTAMYDPAKNKLVASDGSYGETYFYQKALLIHESSHAILDCCYNGRDMNNDKAAGITVLADETIAYLAQAFYLVASNGNMPSNKSAPDYKAVAIVQPRLDAIMKTGWTGCDTIYFTTSDVMSLQTSIKANPAYSNFASIAVHNG
jgi:hypothetical protein